MDAQSVNRRSFLTQVGLAVPGAFALCHLAITDDEKLVKQLGKLDVEFVKSLTDLAKKYDKDGVPEAAHFFASCAIGFGAKDEGLAVIKGTNEGAAYLGTLRGGNPLKETGPITGVLGSIASSYKKALDPLIDHARKGELSESSRRLMFDTGVKYELARGAHQYVQAVQRFNHLRKAMKLRAILWAFEESRKLIQAAWYTGETGHYEYKAPKKESPFYSPSVDQATDTSWGPNALSEYPDTLRTYALIRQDLLNPNARQVRLGHWAGGREVESWGIYSIPQEPYRKDIPTPTERFKGETLVQGWVDVEDTIEIDGKKVPYTRYPYADEPDAPRFFSNGRGGMEYGGWAKSEYSILEKAGVPIILRFFTEGVLADVSAILKGPSGIAQPCRIYRDHDERIDFHRDYPTVLMLPEKQLEPSVRYTVSIRCTLGGAQIEKTWSFTTRAD